jgi:pimeloyl-ACP methyl ester carboxylesterase
MAARLLIAAAALAFSGACIRIAARAYLASASELHPGRGPVARPPGVPDLASVEDVTFVAGGLRFRGWYQPARNGATVVFGHGSGANRAQLLPQAAMLARHGYGVLLFDGPGHGESEGRLTGGPAEVQAFRAAVDLAAARAGGDVLGAFGHSFGACVALRAAAEDERLRALVVDGAPADLREVQRAQFGAWGPLSYWPARLAQWRAGFDSDWLRPLAAAARLGPRPLLVISGAADVLVPPAVAQRVAEAASGPAALWLVPAAGHGEAASREPGEYERRLVTFYERAWRGSAGARNANGAGPASGRPQRRLTIR